MCAGHKVCNWASSEGTGRVLVDRCARVTVAKSSTPHAQRMAWCIWNYMCRCTHKHTQCFHAEHACTRTHTRADPLGLPVQSSEHYPCFMVSMVFMVHAPHLCFQVHLVTGQQDWRAPLCNSRVRQHLKQLLGSLYLSTAMDVCAQLWYKSTRRFAIAGCVSTANSSSPASTWAHPWMRVHSSSTWACATSRRTGASAPQTAPRRPAHGLHTPGCAHCD